LPDSFIPTREGSGPKNIPPKVLELYPIQILGIALVILLLTLVMVAIKGKKSK
jgi:hypothetical protein